MSNPTKCTPTSIHRLSELKVLIIHICTPFTLSTLRKPSRMTRNTHHNLSYTIRNRENQIHKLVWFVWLVVCVWFVRFVWFVVGCGGVVVGWLWWLRWLEGGLKVSCGGLWWLVVACGGLWWEVLWYLHSYNTSYTKIHIKVSIYTGSGTETHGK